MPTGSTRTIWLGLRYIRSGSWSSFPRFTRRLWQVSTAGGYAPRWRGDGKELFFVGYEGAITAVDVTTTSSSVSLGTPHSLFQAALQPAANGPFDVYRDGKQFLLNESAAQEGDTPLTLVTNWLAELKK